MRQKITCGLFILCTLFFQQTSAGKESQMNQEDTPELSDAERIYGLSRFWQEVNYNFAFFDQVPELDWDQAYQEFIPQVLTTESTVAYYRILQRFCALLKDGHTNIYPPDSVNQFYDLPQVRLRAVQQRAIVVDVAESLKGILPRGAEIVAVDGISTVEYLRTEIFPYISSSTEHILWDKGIQVLLEGPAGTEVAIQAQLPQGTSRELKLVRNQRQQEEKWAYTSSKGEWQRLEFRWLEKDLAYVALNTFGDEKIVEDFENHLPELRKCRGLVIDIRRNGGGSSGTGYAIIKHLTSKPFLGSRWKTREHRAAFKAWGKFYAEKPAEEIAQRQEKADAEEREWLERAIDTYNGTFWYESEASTIKPGKGEKLEAPVVVLIGHDTGSAAEDFLIAMDSIQRGTFVGQKTFGSTGQPLTFELPGGGEARVCTKRDTYPDGREFVGYGVLPQVSVEPTVEDILSEKDVVLKKGIEVLRGQMD